MYTAYIQTPSFLCTHMQKTSISTSASAHLSNFLFRHFLLVLVLVLDTCFFLCKLSIGIVSTLIAFELNAYFVFVVTQVAGSTACSTAQLPQPREKKYIDRPSSLLLPSSLSLVCPSLSTLKSQKSVCQTSKIDAHHDVRNQPRRAAPAAKRTATPSNS